MLTSLGADVLTPHSRADGWGAGIARSSGQAGSCAIGASVGMFRRLDLYCKISSERDCVCLSRLACIPYTVNLH